MFQKICSAAQVLVLCLSGAQTLTAAEKSPEAQSADNPTLKLIEVKSTLDQSLQPSLIWAPESAKTKPTPLLVYLHSWSGNYKQNNAKWLKQAQQRGWIYLHPNFRGVNQQPEACGSRLARQDILDAIAFVIDHFDVDQSRVYLAGSSGGGHMTMLMVGHHPDRFSAASAWVGISDLADWYRFHVKDGKPQRYAQMILKSLSAKPGTSKEVDAEYRDRSPLYWIANATEVPLDLNAGVTDGQTGSVPFMHTLRAYNALAKKNHSPLITQKEMQQLWDQGKLQNPRPGDELPDETYGRDIHLRRKSGQARVTIFQGGHEGLPEPACAWLAKQSRDTSGFGKKAD